uniref:F-box domain-containing protein n=1 Tax=Solanum lycopersicum TaxID=4081 RepID=A0A3Q7G487_SOLLC
MEFQKKRKIEVVAMGNGDSSVRRCENLDINILVMIFLSLGLFQLVYAISQVCRAWPLTCCDPRLWKTLDLSEFRRLKTYGVSRKKKIEVVAMENEDSSVRRWEDFDSNILVMIFLSFGLFQWIHAISQVRRAWQLTCCDPRLRKTWTCPTI